MRLFSSDRPRPSKEANNGESLLRGDHPPLPISEPSPFPPSIPHSVPAFSSSSSSSSSRGREKQWASSPFRLQPCPASLSRPREEEKRGGGGRWPPKEPTQKGTDDLFRELWRRRRGIVHVQHQWLVDSTIPKFLVVLRMCGGRQGKNP